MKFREALAGVCATPLPRLHVLSDLHLDSGPYQLAPNLEFDILVAAGDIGPIEQAAPWLATVGKPVVWVLGNHERYGHDLGDAVAKAKALTRGTQVHVLERDVLTLQGVRFVGATLWTDLFEARPEYVSCVGRYLNDYRHITCDAWLQDDKNRRAFEKLCTKAKLQPPAKSDEGATPLHPLMTYVEHTKALAWLKRVLNRDCALPTVVVTHHAPSFESLRRNGVPEYQLTPYRFGFRDSEPARVAAYASEVIKNRLTEPERDVVTLWVHGHTHHGMDYVENTVRVVCNPRGRKSYPLTEESARSYALFGMSLTAADVERSQQLHAASPNEGDAWAFEDSLVLDMVQGPRRAVAQACEKPLAVLTELVTELRTLVPAAGQGTDIKDLCVTRWFEHLLSKVNAQLTLVRTSGLGVLDAEHDRCVFSRLQGPRDVYLWAPMDEDEVLQPHDFEWALKAVETAVQRTAAVPSLLEQHIQEWAKTSLTCLEALKAAGITAGCVALPPSAFRNAQEVELGLCLLSADKDEDASCGLFDKAHQILDTALNPAGPPRQWLPRLYLRVEDAPRRILDEDAVARLATNTASDFPAAEKEIELSS
jgi:Icc-related predicted phosphoesterase